MATAAMAETRSWCW